REAGFGGDQNLPRCRDCCLLSNNIVFAILKVLALIFNNVAWAEILSVLDTAVADKEDTNLKQYFNECFDFIDEAKRNGGYVLVHCYAGRSRSFSSNKLGAACSVTIIVAYLMKSRGMSLSEALEHVKNKRPRAAPNRGFIRQLEDFEKSLQGENCINLKYR
ncbi:dual specificity protein phosphatase 1, partial [Trifolium pratense]